MTVVLVLGFLVVLAVIWLLAGSRRSSASRRVTCSSEAVSVQPPADLFLDSLHTWVGLRTDGTLRVGVDDLLAGLLGQVDRVEPLLRPGAGVERGEPLLVLHQGKRQLTVRAPGAGQVVAVNELLEEDPWVLADDPYGLGWAVSLRPRDHKEALAPLHIGNGAAGLLRAELARAADFLVACLPGPSPLLADGGAPCRGALAGLDDDGWRAFQERFLA